MPLPNHNLPETHVQVQTSSGSSGQKHHQIIIDIKQDIEMDELSTRALTESVMETLAARSVLIDNTNHHQQIISNMDESSNLELETLTTVVVQNENSTQTVISSPGLDMMSQQNNLTTAGRIVAERIAELTNTSPSSQTSHMADTNSNTSTSSSASSSTASGNVVF